MSNRALHSDGMSLLDELEALAACESKGFRASMVYRGQGSKDDAIVTVQIAFRDRPSEMETFGLITDNKEYALFMRAIRGRIMKSDTYKKTLEAMKIKGEVQ